MTLRILGVLAALIAIVGVPFVLKPKANLLAAADDTVVIITPHNEAIRYEFAHAFSNYYQAKTGRSVRIDWRLVGGTSEIARYLESEFYSADERNGGPTGGIGIDLFFGGGAFDFIQQAAAGRLVPSGVIKAHPDWFNEDTIPAEVSGEPFYAPNGAWIGNCLSSFGICANLDSLERLGFHELLSGWPDLTDPRFFKEVALADPTKSGSAAKAFEMVIQQQMQERVSAEKPHDQDGLHPAVASGWDAGLQLILKASANARYFTDAAPKVPMDVSLGDAAIGMCIDFFGRYQSEAVTIDDEPTRMIYFTPVGGSSVGVDPIGLLRGAPHPEVAEAFIAFVLSLEGQKLWNFKVGTPGGPVRYALRRLPIRKELYDAKYAEDRSDPDVQPYEEAKFFTYHPEWTGKLFSPLRFIIRVMCLDAHNEQASAWKALIEADFPPEAMAKFTDVSAVNYERALNVIRPTLKDPDRLQEVILAKQLGDHFRIQYREAERLAKEGK
ncbi:MAG: extracellular solute-binding protein [Chthoniobacterales bacterium]